MFGAHASQNPLKV